MYSFFFFLYSLANATDSLANAPLFIITALIPVKGTRGFRYRCYLILSIDFRRFSSALMPLRANINRTIAINGKQTAKDTENVPKDLKPANAMKA